MSAAVPWVFAYSGLHFIQHNNIKNKGNMLILTFSGEVIAAGDLGFSSFTAI